MEALADVGESVENAGGAEAVTADARKHDKKARSKRTVATVSFVAAVACIVGGAAAFSILPALIALCALGVALVAVGIAMTASAKKARDMRDELCQTYGVTFSELDTYFAKCADALRVRRQAGSERIAASARLEDASESMNTARNTLIQLLTRYTNVTDNSNTALRAQTDEISSRMIAFCKDKKELDTEIGALKINIETLKEQLSPYDREAIRASVTINADSVTPDVIASAERQNAYNKEARNKLDEKVRKLRDAVIRLKATEVQSPIEISDRISKLEEQLSADTEYYEALMLAKESIEAASLSMSGNVTPELSRKAGELMSLVSDGERNRIQTTKELGISLEYDGFLVRSEMLSGGTRDAAYLCLRLALISRLFEDSMPPLLLDEALCHLDDKRASGVLSILSRLCKEMQCIIFTCHSRESTLCRELQIECTEIYL